MPSSAAVIGAARAYNPRRAAESPLYRVVLDHLESLLVRRDRGPGPYRDPCAEDSLRSFLECGIHRFGVARFLCRNCGQDLFIAYSCKRRLACPSCDGKRAVVESSRALAELLPRTPYRQWVLVIPKRLRYFIHRDAALSGELSRLLAETLARFYRRRTGRGAKAAPAQLHVVQRFGSKVNLHVHVHAAVSDGVFELEGGRLRFHPAPEPTHEELAELSRTLRRRILKRMLRLKALPRESGEELLARPHGGFSINGAVRVEADDRAALERLLRYLLRPALSTQRLSYNPSEDWVRYRPKKGPPGDPEVFQWRPLDFLERFAKLIPPARLHLVRYHGGLAPRSPLRPAVTRSAREGLAYEELLAGVPAGAVGAALAAVGRAAGKALSEAARSWAACLRRVFEVEALLCPNCAKEMVLVAAINDDGELRRLMAHLNLPIELPKTLAARSPPDFLDEDAQADPAADAWDGRDALPADD